MYKADFVAADGPSWWLCEREIDYRIEEARTELGAAIGLSDREWYTDPHHRNALYDLLEAHGSQLVNDLDSLCDDDAKLQWVRDAMRQAAPPQTAPIQSETIDAAPPADLAKPPAVPSREPTVADTVAADSAAESQGGGEAAAPTLDHSVQTVLADVTGEGLAGLAQDLGVEAGELEAILNHPEFEREVREELARITAE